MNRRAWLLGLGCALVACKRETPAPIQASPSASAPPPSATSAIAPPSASAAPPSAPVLHLVATSPASLSMAALDGAAVLYDEQGAAFALAQGDELAFDSSLRAGIPVKPGFPGSIMSMSGRWPGAVWLTVQTWPGRGEWKNALFRWKNGWQPTGENDGALMYYDEAMPWSEGRMLTLRTSSGYRGLVYCDIDFVVLHGDKPAVMPRAQLQRRPPGDDSGPARCSRLIPEVGGLRALPSGEVFLLGADDDNGRVAAVERWKAGAAESTIDRLPGNGKIEVAGIEARAANDVRVAGSIATGKKKAPYLAHFDGAAWSVQEPPPDTLPIHSLAESAAGTWLVGSDGDKSSLHFRPRGGAWQRVALPEGTPPGTVITRAVAARDDVWIRAVHTVKQGSERKATTLIFRTRPAKSVLDFAPFTSDEPPPADPKLRPATAECDKVFVVLYTLSQDAPADYDFPATRRAIKGHTELEGARFVETDDGQRRYFGAFVPTLDMGKQLAAAIRRRVPKSRPEVLCGDPPRVRRTLKIDLATGELQKDAR